MKCLTWNIENIWRNIYSLKHIIDIEQPEFAFLNEVQLYQCDKNEVMEAFKGEYCFSLNSEDIFEPDLCLNTNRAKGGTMILWRRILNQDVTVLPTKTASFLALRYHPFGSQGSVHIALYLPTSGKEYEFVRDITALGNFVEEVIEANPTDLIYIRGDSNVNKNHSTRVKMLNNFLHEQNLFRIPINHTTYHHFLGDGLYDSNIDVILQTDDENDREEVLKLYCNKKYPIINSHHDVIISVARIPVKNMKVPVVESTAPVVANNRKKIIWNPEDIPSYQMAISDNLKNLRRRWMNPDSKTSISILLELTSLILSSCASSTNHSIDLSKPKQIKSVKIPKAIRKSNRNLMKKMSIMNNLNTNNPIEAAARKLDIKKAKISHRHLVRKIQNDRNISRDVEVYQLLSANPSSIYKKIKARRKALTGDISTLKVGDIEYVGENVKDGFYQSIKTLKTNNEASKPPNLNWAGVNIEEDYRNILDICKHKVDLPSISMADSTRILKKMKTTVNDFYNITTLHYINAGKHGIEHFNFLLNCIISDVNNASVEELNTIYALLLHKGHGKQKTVASSYRTISSCPLLSKALDIYIREVHEEKWKAKEAKTQYQGEGSNSELAALLLTEVVQFSLYQLREPIYILFLDAKSAFDVVKPKILIRNMYLAGMDGNSTTFINNRLLNRHTFLEWNRHIMGPIRDEFGLEQGGVNSGDYYKLYNNDLLSSTQLSEQGVNLGYKRVISSIGLADDTALVANSLACLANILEVALAYCKKFEVSLCAGKTKLLRITGTKTKQNLELYNPIKVSGQSIEFTNYAEHVGIIRSVDGNLPNLLDRLAAHTRALNATLSAGAARRHRANPLVGLRIEKIYACPVLMSGLGSLVLLESEIMTLDQHYKETCQNLQKLLPKTPRSVVYFLAGSLPARAILHMKQLCLLGMIARLKEDPLHGHACSVLSESKPSSRSWFWQLRDICLMYNLPHPLTILANPPTAKDYKKQVRSHVVDYWERKLRQEALNLPSLLFFHPHYMSLTCSHPIWSTVGSNPYEVTKAIQQARLLSGRYRTECLSRHWQDNPQGYCLVPGCSDNVETVQHILLECEAYNQNRDRLSKLWLSNKNPIIKNIISETLSSSREYQVQFILDCSVLPAVISASQQYGSCILDTLFYLTRTWCYSIHRSRMKLLGRWHLK